MLQTLRDDLLAVFDRDPAARNIVEVVLAYPGLHAIWLHRLAHRMHGAGIPIFPRLLSHFNRWITGIEIHPGATIGRGFFIDHGMGVVIGETAEIGDNVTLYQGVTLGIYHAQAARRLRGTKRHPTLGDGVIAGVGAKILGAITIGRGAIIAPGAVVTRDVPAYATAMGIPARIVTVRDPETGEKRRVDVAQPRLADLPDPLLELIRCMQEKIAELESRLTGVEAGDTPARAPTVAAPTIAPLPIAPSTVASAGRTSRESPAHLRTNGVKRPCGDQLERALRAAVAEREGSVSEH
ncbi:MAG: serine O-acetyltransferase [Chloroflexota bacterium]|nr:serine O-acetyltransferase [Chloroflexota bacterium]